MSTYETQGSVIIEASPAQIMNVLSDVEHYPEWIPDIQAVTVTARDAERRPQVLRFMLKKGLYRDELEFEIVWDANERVDWILIASIVERNNIGSYTLTDRGKGRTQVVFDVRVQDEFPSTQHRQHEISKEILNSALCGLSARVAETL